MFSHCMHDYKQKYTYLKIEKYQIQMYQTTNE